MSTSSTFATLAKQAEEIKFSEWRFEWPSIPEYSRGREIFSIAVTWPGEPDRENRNGYSIAPVTLLAQGRRRPDGTLEPFLQPVEFLKTLSRELPALLAENAALREKVAELEAERAKRQERNQWPDISAVRPGKRKS